MSEFQHEDGAWDLDENEVLDPADSLEGNLTDDPLDQGIALPDRWSRALRRELDADEDSASLEELLDAEEPDDSADSDVESWDENDSAEDVARKERALGQQRRAGRLIAHEEEMYADSDTSLVLEDRITALDVGIDGGAASAEEAAVHVVDNDDEEAGQG
jgi:Family of unknown function (DUF5709)